MLSRNLRSSRQSRQSRQSRDSRDSRSSRASRDKVKWEIFACKPRVLSWGRLETGAEKKRVGVREGGRGGRAEKIKGKKNKPIVGITMWLWLAGRIE